ncbi:NERD domain-containing protein [Nocardia thailandica]
MLVRIRPGAELSGSEQEFVDCLRKLPGAGLALIDPVIGGRHSTAVVLTPRGMTVLTVLGFRRRQSGLLKIGANAPWTISDEPLELDDSAPAKPLDRLEDSVWAVRHALEQSLQDGKHVRGAIVLIPYRGVVVRPARTTLRPGRDVVVGNSVDLTDLRIYLEGFTAAPRAFTIDRVLHTCTALGLRELAPSPGQLAADGFDENEPPPVDTFLERVSRRRTDSVPVAPPAPPSTGSGRWAGWIVLALAMFGLLVVLVVVIRAVLTDDPQPRTVSEVSSVSSSTTAPAPLSTPVECFPFQPAC